LKKILSRCVGAFACLILLLSVSRTNATALPPDDARAAIEQLHQQDVAATLTQDPKALADLFTENAVLLEPDNVPVIGRKAILAGNEQDRAAHPEMKFLSYKPEIKDLQIRGNWAFEWDTFDASYKESEKGEVKNFRAKALRVLERQPDGSWKFSRVMWNMDKGQ